jgi:hypothetical protein
LYYFLSTISYELRANFWHVFCSFIIEPESWAYLIQSKLQSPMVCGFLLRRMPKSKTPCALIYIPSAICYNNLKNDDLIHEANGLKKKNSFGANYEIRDRLL